MKLKSALPVMAFVLGGISSSCNQSQTSLIRPVYGDYKLGVSMEEATLNVMDKVYSGALKTIDESGKQVVYEEHITAKGEKYYSSFQFVKPDADTIVIGMNMFFACSPSIDLGTQKTSFQNNENLMLNKSENDQISDYAMTQDILKNLKLSYGQFDDSKIEKNDFADWIETYYWKNRKDVDITLLRIGKNSYSPIDGRLQYRYFVLLKYRYTDAMLNKIDYKKSKF